ncbi:glycosyl hydrolases family 31-domain-containing protein [Macrophomina phaseolina]|uniref:Glycosyl hydrolases family 31-domain-containing protein n=1 Tax=Macrophomina phaseolina TaxID=35725 RepID=A0ABQ8GKG2_9PEZI|nr:glycosyl hydrolases family 31-domain-containing protein [Macrophomina phaseolina]
MRWAAFLLPPAAIGAAAQHAISVLTPDPYTLTITHKNETVLESIRILTGTFNYTADFVSASDAGDIANAGGRITSNFVSDTVAKIQINANNPYVGADIGAGSDALRYGVWEYPWDGKVANENVTFEIKGIGEATGVNWSNARAPFFLSSAGYGIYIDTLAMGLFDFSNSGSTRFVFNATSLTVYAILPTAPGDYKSILTQYAKLSSYIYMPPDTAYGPIVYSDNWETDFHGDVSNAQENYYDVVDHLFDNHIRASAMFADRPYGTGNGSWGNFDFNLTAYPAPADFIANLSDWGYDFQAWVANRATPGTVLWNASVVNNWQFEFDYATLQGGLAGPALNLSIPEAYAFFSDHLQAFTDLGVRGYKIDRGEEEEMPVWEQNIQMSLFEELCYANMLSAWGEGNFFSFARSVFDRSRSHAAVWNGDAHANFTGLAYSVASGIRAGLLGFSMWGSDTGGYIREGEEPVPTEEVWARWMHFATFSPMYELMLGTGATPWYAPYTSDLVAVFRETADLHHQLLPYIRSYTYAAHTTGLPVMRALFLEEPADEASWIHSDNEYFFGAELLVAPVVTAGGTRDVYFPGSNETLYLEYLNKSSVYRGGETVSVELGVHDVPVYVKAGAIIPRGDIFRANDRWTEDWKPYLDLEVFPSFDIPKSQFKYFNKEKNVTVDITLTMDDKKAEVEYGELGFNGTVLFYLKDGVKKVDMTPSGGGAIVYGAQSLFKV